MRFTTNISRPVGLGAALLLSAVLSGCMHVYRPSASVRMEPIASDFTASGDITLINGQNSSGKVVFMPHFSTNLRDCTAVAIQYAQQVLETRGMHVGSGAAKTLTLSVNSIDTQVGFVRVETQLVLGVRTGDGYTTQYVSRNNSEVMANVSRQCNGAIMRAVKLMFDDPKVVRYLTR